MTEQTISEKVNMTSSKDLTVFYDGNCPMCRREIRHYQGMKGADTIEWVDITCAENDIQQYGIDIDMAMARFHVLDHSGKWHTGAFGFVEMWRQLPALGWAASIIKRLHLTGLLDRFYTVFAKWRLKKRCKDGSCSTYNSLPLVRK